LQNEDVTAVDFAVGPAPVDDTAGRYRAGLGWESTVAAATADPASSVTAPAAHAMTTVRVARSLGLFTIVPLSR